MVYPLSSTMRNMIEVSMLTRTRKTWQRRHRRRVTLATKTPPRLDTLKGLDKKTENSRKRGRRESRGPLAAASTSSRVFSSSSSIFKAPKGDLASCRLDFRATERKSMVAQRRRTRLWRVWSTDEGETGKITSIREKWSSRGKPMKRQYLRREVRGRIGSRLQASIARSSILLPLLLLLLLLLSSSLLLLLLHHRNCLRFSPLNFSIWLINLIWFYPKLVVFAHRQILFCQQDTRYPGVPSLLRQLELQQHDHVG